MGIWNPTIWSTKTFEIQTFWRSDWKWSSFQKAIASVPTIWKQDHPKSKSKSQISNGLWHNGSYCSGFQMVELPDLRCHSKSKTLVTQPLFDHLKSRLVWISDPHCMIRNVCWKWKNLFRILHLFNRIGHLVPWRDVRGISCVPPTEDPAGTLRRKIGLEPLPFFFIASWKKENISFC